MKTQVLPITPESVALAARLLQQGELVALPTETVYGLGADGLDETAVLHIFEAKGIPVWVDLWGHDVKHDWDWWYKQVVYYMPYILGQQ